MIKCAIPLVVAGVFFAFAASAATISEVRFNEEISPEWLAEIVGAPVVIQRGVDGMQRASLPNDVVRELHALGTSFDVFRTHTEVAPFPPDKSQKDITGYDGVGFPINPANSASIIISGAPAGAEVSSVTARIRGTAAFAEDCTFELRDAAANTYTFPTWFDMIDFDHTVTGITTFNGRPVNQTWTLWGQGSNVAGEWVNEWWVTIYYAGSDEGEPEGEGEGEGEGEPPPPSVRITGPRRAEVGQSITLVGQWTSLVGELDFEWHKDGSEIIGAEGPEYHIPFADFADAGDYVLFIEDESKALWESDPFTLEVFPEGSLPTGSLLMLGLLAVVITGAGVRHNRRS